MAYLCQLSAGQQVYLDSRGAQTIVTVASGSPGQQQQSSSSIQTGNWTTPPAAFQTPQGVVLKVQSAQGDYFIQVQGNSMSLLHGAPSLNQAQSLPMQQVADPSASSMPPMQPMQPMQPMRMGNMEMQMNPMEMRMGDMEMRMGTPDGSPAEAPPGTRRFCSQCGTQVKESDRFCSSCGHQLK
jgi:hypothetical protein